MDPSAPEPTTTAEPVGAAPEGPAGAAPDDPMSPEQIEAALDEAAEAGVPKEQVARLRRELKSYRTRLEAVGDETIAVMARLSPEVRDSLAAFADMLIAGPDAKPEATQWLVRSALGYGGSDVVASVLAEIAADTERAAALDPIRALFATAKETPVNDDEGDGWDPSMLTPEKLEAMIESKAKDLLKAELEAKLGERDAAAQKAAAVERMKADLTKLGYIKDGELDPMGKAVLAYAHGNKVSVADAHEVLSGMGKTVEAAAAAPPPPVGAAPTGEKPAQYESRSARREHMLKMLEANSGTPAA